MKLLCCLIFHLLLQVHCPLFFTLSLGGWPVWTTGRGSLLSRCRFVWPGGNSSRRGVRLGSLFPAPVPVWCPGWSASSTEGSATICYLYLHQVSTVAQQGHHKLSDLKQRTLIILLFLWLRHPGQQRSGVLCKAATKVSSGLQPHLKAWPKRDLLSSSHGSWQHLVPWRLSDRGTQCLASCRPETALVPCHVALSMVTAWQLASSRPAWEGTGRSPYIT